jgi:glycosyltransferase involved in cell wall biosynthesis
MLTLHGMMWKEKDYARGIYSKFAYELTIRKFNYISPRLKKLIAISPYVVGEVDAYLNSKVPAMEVIENPVSDAFFEQDKNEKEGLIVYPAYFNSLKNQITLIQALCRLKKEHVRFHCILPGPILDNTCYTTITSLIKSCGLEKDVTIPGPVPFSEMLRLYSEASVMVMTSYQETAPLVISEAMASRTPVIASRVSGIPYMVSEGNSGFLINPHDPGEVADRIRILLEDSSLRNRFGGEARRIAESRWKSEVITSRLIDVYLRQKP